MKKFLSMAALALVGAIMTGCSSDDDSIISNPQQPENTGKVVTLTTTVGLDGGATTRALTETGVKTFAENEQIAVVYKQTGGTTAVAVSEKLTTGDITGGTLATFTVTLDDPDKTQDVTYIYPAAMANADGSINYAALATQDGTLTTLASDLDLATYTGAWSGASLPTGTLANQLAILAITLKDNATTPTEITNITGLTVSDGTNTYSVTRSAAAGPIYVAIQPTSDAEISVTATDGSLSYDNYGKFLAEKKTYAASNGYSVSWKMLPRVDLSTISGTSYTVTGNVILTGTPSGNLNIGCNNDNYEVTLDNVNPDRAKDVRIKSNRTVTVKLKGTSKLTQIATTASGKNLTIDKAAADGTVILKMNSTTETPLDAYGTITINGGTVKAKQESYYQILLTNVVINGGKVYLALQNNGQFMPFDKNFSGSVPIYSWSNKWVNFTNYCQYASTDNSSGNNPSTWTWW